MSANTRYAAEIQHICNDRDYQAFLKTAEQTKSSKSEREFYHSILMNAAHYAITGYGRRMLLGFLQVGGFFSPGEEISAEPFGTCFWETLPCRLPVGKFLDVSTAHITAKDYELLDIDFDAKQPAAIVFRKDDHGFFVHVPHDDVEEYEQELREAGYSEEFTKLIQLARAEGASLLCVDADGSVSDKLPHFDW